MDSGTHTFSAFDTEASGGWSAIDTLILITGVLAKPLISLFLFPWLLNSKKAPR